MDESSEKRRRVKLKKYINEILLNLVTGYKGACHRIDLACDEDIGRNLFLEYRAVS